jgi:hypothetical protein
LAKPYLREAAVMPRLVHAVPKYQKHRASGQAVVSINGRDHYLGPHGTKASKLEYDRLITEWLSSGRSHSFGSPSPALTVVELLADYLKYAAKYYGTAPRGEYPQIVRSVRPVRELHGRTAAEDFGVLQFKAVREKTATSDRSRKYVNATMRRVVQMFKWAAAEGLISTTTPQFSPLTTPSWTPPSRTSPKSSPTWFDSSGLPECGRPKYASSDPAI